MEHSPNIPIIDKTQNIIENTQISPYPSSRMEYETIENLGHGSYGHVVLAKILTGTLKSLRVAIKILDLDNYNPEDWIIIEKELTLLQMVSHPNLISSLHCFMDNSDLYLLMPYMNGGSCAQIIKKRFRKGFCDEILVASILRQVLEGLVYLHGDSRIHRDIKAGNILLSMDGNVKLGDFGVSRCLMEAGERKGVARTFTGTPCWMAPEVMHMEKGYDYKADIWSFGITALEMAYGKPPLANHTPLKILVMTLKNKSPSTSSYPEKDKFSKSFKNMIDICLKKEADRRPSAKELLKHKFIKKALGPDYIRRALFSDGAAQETNPQKGQKATPIPEKKSKAVPIGKFNFEGVVVEESKYKKKLRQMKEERDRELAELEKAKKGKSEKSESNLSESEESDEKNVKWGKKEKKGKFVIKTEDL